MDDLLSPLTLDGRRVLANAKQIAKRHNRPVIDSEMLLLGLLQLSGSQAEGILKDLHIKLENLIVRLSASIKLEARQEQAHPEPGFSQGQISLSPDSTAILSEAFSEAQQHGLDFVDTRLLLLGMLRCPESKAGRLLAQYGLALDQFRAQAHLETIPPTNLPRFRLPSLSLDSVYFGISPIFIGLALFTALSGYLVYAGIGNSRATLFFFIIGGWIISVALHEFGHALAAFINLLPIPGLDGFGIIHPFLPPDMAYKANLIRPFSFFILYGLLFVNTPVQDLFWTEIWEISVRINPDLAALAYQGLQSFQLW